ncbi:MAG: hypothetical protein AAFY41_11225 [Bacteroidota bacterium]
MKKNLFILMGMLVVSIALANGQFEKAMGNNIPAVFSAADPESLQSVINQLNRIGEAEGDRWEPFYYMAFGYIRMSGMYEEATEKDKYLDLAMSAVEKAEEIKPNDSELEAMRGYVNMIKLTVDPGSRGMTYSGLAFNSFNKAVALDPSNPRAHYLLGRMQYGTAQFMGGGDGGACVSLSKAKKLFTEATASSNPIAPSWGKEDTDNALKQICEKGE